MKKSSKSIQKAGAGTSRLSIFLFSVLFPACLMYTVITLIMTGAAASFTGFAPSFSALLSVFFFSLIVFLLGLLFRIGRLPFVLALLLHYVGSAVSFVLIFVFIAGKGTNVRGGLILTALLSVLYWIAGAVAGAVRGRKKSKEKENESYKSMFS